MSNKFDDEQAFLKWLDESASQGDDLKEVTEPKWKERSYTASALRHQALMEPQHNVPKWDRSAAFSTDKTPWWQWRPMPALSMAFSIVAVALVLFKVELVVQPDGMMITFASDAKATNDAEVSRLVDLKLREFAAEQQVMLANYTTDVNSKQQASNLQLATYIISATRQERKEDMNDFIGYINDQREDENLTQKIKFLQLERKIDQTSYKQSVEVKRLNTSEHIKGNSLGGVKSMSSEADKQS
jgi:hypothetical protein